MSNDSALWYTSSNVNCFHSLPKLEQIIEEGHDRDQIGSLNKISNLYQKRITLQTSDRRFQSVLKLKVYERGWRAKIDSLNQEKVERNGYWRIGRPINLNARKRMFWNHSLFVWMMYVWIYSQNCTCYSVGSLFESKRIYAISIHCHMRTMFRTVFYYFLSLLPFLFRFLQEEKHTFVRIVWPFL